MNDEILYIDMIDSYLEETLSQQERIHFENSLKTDLILTELYIEHKAVLKGMERYVLKNQIVKAGKQYKRFQRLKHIGIGLGITLIIGILIMLIFSKTEEVQESEIENRSGVYKDVIQQETSDSLTIKKDILSEKQLEILPKTQKPDNRHLHKPQKIFTPDTIMNIENTPANQLLIDTDSIVQSLERKAILSPPIIFEDVVKQLYEIQTERDTLITTSGGIGIHIPRHAFKNKTTQKLIRGKVIIELQEYLALSDMIKAGLTTMSGVEILQSCGMLHITVTKNNTACDLNDNTTIGLTFPESNTYKDFQLFEGDTSKEVIDWKPLKTSIDKKPEPPLTQPQSSTITNLFIGDSIRTPVDSLLIDIPIKSLNVAFQTNKLGWINCDRFINYKGEKAPVRVTIMAEDKINVNVFLVFHESKSILSAYSNGINYVFNNIPVDKKVTIIAIGQSENPDQYYYLDRTLDGGNWNTNMRLEKMAKDILFQKLEHLDTIH